MPILDIEIVSSDLTFPQDLAQRLADDLTDLFGALHNQLWVKVHRLSADHYAENGGMQEHIHPVFVNVLMAKWPDVEQMADFSAMLASKVGDVLGQPADNIHVIFLPEATGRIAFGGKLLSRTEVGH